MAIFDEFYLQIPINPLNLLFILIMAGVAWAPFYITNRIKKCIFPKVVEKINMAEKKS